MNMNQDRLMINGLAQWARERVWGGGGYVGLPDQEYNGSMVWLHIHDCTLGTS